ncbi:hypothetical protein [Corynebacterium lubricantis]|uniref:hypothetical protein n=1 Tax=Corynebacterium lubricantis TaxID=541095 RepID=UPI0003785B84|nr:hypothetical protein [Corynebacterium lubricantis]
MNELLAADSFTVRDGKVRGLSLHLARFQKACLARGYSLSMDKLNALVSQAEGSPRLELHASGVGLRNRPARKETDTVTLADTGARDTRKLPLIKGPDLDWLGSILADSPAEEVVLVDSHDRVVEACFSTPVLFHQDHTGSWIAEFPQHPRQLDSVTARLVRAALNALDVDVFDGPPTTVPILLEQPAWFLNATHVRRIENPDGPKWPTELLALQRDVVVWLDDHAEVLPEN